MNKIRKGDEIIVITGKDKGRTGKVLSVQIKDGKPFRVVVAGIAMVIKHKTANPAKGIEGGRIQQERAIHVSNVALVDENGKPSRVRIEVRDEKKVRVLKTTNASV